MYTTLKLDSLVELQTVQKIPSKMFNNEESALNWIQSLKKEMLKKA